MNDCNRKISQHCCRSLHGERGLKSVWNTQFPRLSCRSLHGERGLKFLLLRL
ncbi:hypothetical protein CLONEX_02498 [[Clostridium] nexile DSM 1787]|nr:hypothetical protein CLONEX_02498 [[Clostridium] nexile DSM 1787]